MPYRLPTDQTIEIDTQRKLVSVRISGFFLPEVAHAATWETRRAIQSLGTAMGQHVTLYDTTDTAPLPGETVELIRASFANPLYRPLWARRLAFCTPSALLKRQIERLREVRGDIGIFDDRGQALAWLHAG